ncbi:MAG: hypothetical protein ACC630_08415 [Nitrospinota bacterium]
MTKNILAILYLIAFLFSAAEISAYEVDTHEEISEEAFNVSVLKSGYLNNLWLTETEKLKGEDVKGWIIVGSQREDDKISPSPLRFRNHFFDPTMPISESGLILPVLGNIGKPAPNWGLEEPDTYFTQRYSIKDARTYLYKGLTMTTKGKREKNLALCFRSLGQVIHLIQDMAQPQHVRNDPHGGYVKPILGEQSEYEEFVFVNDIKYYLSYGYTPPIFSIYREFWTGKGEGLAEFTNRNFVSVGTNFDTTTYPSPSLSAVTTIAKPIQDVIRTDNPNLLALTGNVIFIGSDIDDKVTGQTYHNDFTSTYAIFDYDLEERGYKAGYSMNRFNYFAAADSLIKRAVGYSAGLINHFFRGQLTIPSAIESKDINGDIDGITIKTGNITGWGEDMTNGEILISYRYIPSGSAEYTYALSNTLTGVAIPNNNNPDNYEYQFTLSAPIPSDAADTEYILVYKGALGNEQGAVIAKKIEPTPDQAEGLINTSGGDSLGLAYPGDGGNVTIESSTSIAPISAAQAMIIPSGETLDLSPGSYEYTYVTIDGTLSVSGPGLTLSVAGDIKINTDGSITIENGINGGDITIESNGKIIINGEIDISGKNSTSNAGNGGNGGAFSFITSSTSPLLIPTIVTRGGDSDSADCPNRYDFANGCDSFIGGRGGDITITSNGGDIILAGGAPPIDTLPPPPPYKLGTPDKPRPDAGERLPLLYTGFNRGLLTTGGIGGSGTGFGSSAGGGGTGGDGGNISIDSGSGKIVFHDIDLFTGGEIEKVLSDIFVFSRAREYRFYSDTGSLGGKGNGGGSSYRGGDGGKGGKGGDITVAGQIAPAVNTVDRAIVFGHDKENPNLYDSVPIGDIVSAFDSDGDPLYRVKVYDNNGTDMTMGGFGGFPGGSSGSFPGWFGVKGDSGILTGLLTR